MKHVVSFCLWGNNPHYHDGALKALASVLELYPGWEAWVYLAEDVPEKITDQLRSNSAKVITMRRGSGSEKCRSPAKYQYQPAFWRFLPADDPQVERLIVRDSDSPVTAREVEAVSEWIESGMDFHIMRDHPKHEYPILAGMWGAQTRCIRDIKSLIARWRRFDYYGCDQKFLAQVIYPRVKSASFIHSECIKFPGEVIHRFPTHRPADDFIGISHTGDDERLALQLRCLREWNEAGKPVYLRPLPWSFLGLARIYSRGKWPKNKCLPSIAP